MAVVDFVQHHERQNLAYARDGTQAGEGVGIVWLGTLDAGQLQGGQPLIVVGEQGQVDLDVLLRRRIGKALGHAAAVGLVGDVLADRGQVVLAVGLLPLGQEVGPLAHQGDAAPQQVTGRPHVGGLDRGLGRHAAAQQRGNLVGIALVVFGLAPVKGLHIERMARDEGNPLLGAEVGQPVPGEETFERDNEALTIGCNGLEERFRGGFHGAVPQDVPVMVHETDVHGAGLQVDTAVKLVLVLGGEAPEVSSSFMSERLSQRPHTTVVC